MRAPLAATILLLAAPAAGEPMSNRPPPEEETPTGSRIARPLDKRTLAGEHAGEVRKRFANCVFRRSKPEVLALLANSDPMSIDPEVLGDSDEETTRKFKMSACLGRAGAADYMVMRARPQALRGLLLEEAYLAAMPAPPPGAATPPPPRTYTSEGDDLAQAKTRADFADCLIRTDARAADALLRTPPGSAEEQQAVAGLMPALKACVFKGQTLSLTPDNLRVFVADGLWHAFGRAAAD